MLPVSVSFMVARAATAGVLDVLDRRALARLRRYNPAMSFAVVLEKNDEGGWTATCPILPGCISEGETREEALRNIRDAIHLYQRAMRKELALMRQQGKQVAHVTA